MCFVAVKTIQLTMDTKEQIKYDSCVIDILYVFCVSSLCLIYKAVCISGGGGKSEVAAGL